MRFLFTTLAALALVLSVDASSAQAMRCGTRLVREGSTPSQVRANCGEPDDVITTTETRQRTVYSRVAGVLVADTISVEVQVQQWVYNLGPQRFMRRLIFENGVLVEIEQLERGN
jgi:hypothetical protein